MYTVDEIEVAAPVDACVDVAADVERWPEILPHYRWVRFQRKDGFASGRVEMAARRPFGPLSYPVWWVSEMTIDREEPAVLYRHVDGVTRSMEVVWSFKPRGEGRTHIRIVHAWEVGPHWPLPRILRSWIARLIIGPIFIHHVASRTLKGVRAEAERQRRAA
jgi:ribosome-associated toxin RatA of RatAB toxin-antitoxin module